MPQRIKAQIEQIAHTVGSAEPGVAVTDRMAALGRTLKTLDQRVTVKTVERKLRALLGRPATTPSRPPRTTKSPTRPAARRSTR